MKRKLSMWLSKRIIRITDMVLKWCRPMIGEEKKNGVVSFILEVRPSNLSAHRCYQKLGFRTIGIRRDFYDCPKENALVMKMESIAGDE